MTTTGPTWYVANTGGDQGLVVDEATGANIAVTYDKAHAELIVRAVNSHADLLAALEYALPAIAVPKAFERARAAIRKARP